MGLNKRILFSTHAVVRARQRRIFPDMVKASIDGGRIERFGCNQIRFVKDYRKGKVVCIGVEEKECIIIKTIEWKH
ncbi:MAG: hypothetical protein AB1467_03165 [Candidatus Diapherotrites archaeon]